MFDLSEVEKEVLLMGNLKSALADGDLDTQEQAVELVDRNWDLMSEENKIIFSDDLIKHGLSRGSI